MSVSRNDIETGGPPPRIVLGMLGTDVHSKGIRTLSARLREAGFDVDYIGEHNSPDAMANAVARAEADIVGVSFSSGAYLHYVAELTQGLKDAAIGNVGIMVGGLIHPDDHARLHELGVSGVFGPGSTLDAICDFVVDTTKKVRTQSNHTDRQEEK